MCVLRRASLAVEVACASLDRELLMYSVMGISPYNCMKMQWLHVFLNYGAITSFYINNDIYLDNFCVDIYQSGKK